MVFFSCVFRFFSRFHGPTTFQGPVAGDVQRFWGFVRQSLERHPKAELESGVDSTSLLTGMLLGL